jgi:hypothetical protein
MVVLKVSSSHLVLREVGVVDHRALGTWPVITLGQPGGPSVGSFHIVGRFDGRWVGKSYGIVRQARGSGGPPGPLSL